MLDGKNESSYSLWWFGNKIPSEETRSKPKPMVKIGKFPILFHIMKIYENMA